MAVQKGRLSIAADFGDPRLNRHVLHLIEFALTADRPMCSKDVELAAVQKIELLRQALEQAALLATTLQLRPRALEARADLQRASNLPVY